MALVGTVSMTQGWATMRFSATRAAAVTWAIMKPEFTPLSLTRKAGRSVILGSTRMEVRRSEILPISHRAMAI
ncbi:hypothetical protein D3C72_1799380 [compost metagenome]